jgi:hypothetical protein
MSSGRYFVAKYVPHLQRMEPRNIGVILWTPYGVEARFVGEKTDTSGDIDGRSAKSYVRSVNTYKQWVSFWRNEIAKEEINPATGGCAVSRESEAFLETLQSGNNGNYYLADGGLVLDPVGSDELNEAVDYLYYELVGKPDEDDETELSVKSVCADLVKRTRVNRSPSFRSDYKVQVDLMDSHRTTSYEFDYAIVNESLRCLYQRVHLPKKRLGGFAKNAHDSAWMFEKVVGAKLITADSGAAFVYVDDEFLTEPEVRDPLVDLESVTRVLNLKDKSDLETAEVEFGKFASSQRLAY